ncbi:MAG: hypothetical protein JSS72_11645 [Armatimonadetes bacterium]|nr:hypothetical protein [Armatimonadota bacterium]
MNKVLASVVLLAVIGGGGYFLLQKKAADDALAAAIKGNDAKMAQMEKSVKDWSSKEKRWPRTEELRFTMPKEIQTDIDNSVLQMNCYPQPTGKLKFKVDFMKEFAVYDKREVELDAPFK